MNSTQKYCRCCYAFEAVKTLEIPALNIYKLISNTKDLEDEDSPITTCPQCYEFLEKVLCFKFECASVDDYFRNELNVKHHKGESILDNAADEGSSQLNIKTEVIEENLSISDKLKWQSLDHSFNSVEQNLLIELCDRKKQETVRKQNSVDLKKNQADCDKPLKCSECSYKTTTKHRLNIHIAYKHSDDKPFSCDRCSYSAKTKQDLKSHITWTHLDAAEYPYKCNECSYKTTTTGYLKRHIAYKHSDVRPFSCELCNYSAKIKQDLVIHKRVHLDVTENSYKCNECSYITTNTVYLKRHIAYKHSDEKPFSCDLCNYSAKIKQTLELHIIRAHMDVAEYPYKCSECSFKTATTALLKRHVTQRHSDDKPFSCDCCNYSSKIKHDLIVHKRVHLDVPKNLHNCNECSYKTTNTTLLKRHIASKHNDGKLIHLDVAQYPYKCNECSYVTKTPTDLQLHIAHRHSDEKPFSCDRCSYSAKTIQYLTRHKRLHLDDNENPYKCKECSYKTTSTAGLKRHMAQRHSDEKPFTCDRCSYAAKIKQDLVIHKRIHLDVTENPYKCNECSYKTTTTVNLKEHIARKHSNDKPFGCDRCDYSAKTKKALAVHKRLHLDNTEIPTNSTNAHIKIEIPCFPE